MERVTPESNSVVTRSRSNPSGEREQRIRVAARVFGVRLPAYRGRKPRLRGDSKDNIVLRRFMDEMNAYHKRNAFSDAIRAAIDDLGYYRNRLNKTQRRAVVRRRESAARACVARVRRPAGGARRRRHRCARRLVG